MIDLPRRLGGRLLASATRRFHGLKRGEDVFARSSHSGTGTYLGNNRVLVRVHLNGWPIGFLVPADDLLITPWFIMTGTYEIALARFFVNELRHDSRCIDVGANFGFFTCVMAKFAPAGRVIGIEADQRIFELVRDNIAINGLVGARAVNAAANADGTPLTLYRRATRPANTSIIPYDDDFTRTMGEPPVQSFSVPGIRIDDVAAELGGRVDFLKIDVEGAEPLAFQGASETIRTNPRLTIVMEWSPGQMQSAGFDVGAFVDALGATGMRLHTLEDSEADPQPLAFDALRSSSYHAGIVLTRAA